LRRRRARLFVVALAAGRFVIAGQCVRRLIGRGISAIARFGRKKRSREEERIKRTEEMMRLA
jgi:hypothetical protein